MAHQQRPPSASIKVRVQPGASRNEVVGYQGDTLRLRVTAPPEGGRANEAVVSLLAEALGVARGRVKIVRGHASRNKVALVEALAPEDAAQRLSARTDLR